MREWRKARAEADSVPAYVVFTDATLEALAEVRPTTRQAMLKVNGVGAAKLDKYADELLELLGLTAGGGADRPARRSLPPDRRLNPD